MSRAGAYCARVTGHNGSHHPGMPCIVCGRLISVYAANRKRATGRCVQCRFPPDYKCTRCGYRLRSDNKSGLCKLCRPAARSRKRTVMLAQLKITAGCADCGYDDHPDALCLGFTGEGKSPMASLLRACSLDRLFAEIARCDVVCGNCHAHRLAERLRDRWRGHVHDPGSRMLLERRARVTQVKLDAGCTDCGFRKWAEALQFDHVNGDKIAPISGITGSSWEVVSAEIAKCEVRCVNCHRIRTAHGRAA